MGGGNFGEIEEAKARKWQCELSRGGTVIMQSDSTSTNECTGGTAPFGRQINVLFFVTI